MDKIKNYNANELETWDQRDAMSTGRKWKRADLVLKLNKQRSGAREGTVSRGEIPTMNSDQGEKR